MSLQRRVLVLVVGLLLTTVMLLTTSLVLITRNSLIEQTKRDGLLLASLLAESVRFVEQVPDDVEAIIGDQMVVQAKLAAYLVSVAEDAGWLPDQINAMLEAVAQQTVVDEFWITDERGYAYLGTEPEFEFTFSPDPREQPQSYVFWPLLTGEVSQVIQAAMDREVDDQLFKYVGVGGVDQPRIVQVGYNAILIDTIREQVGLPSLVSNLLANPAVGGIRIYDADFNPLAVQLRSSSNRSEILAGVELDRARAVIDTGQSGVYINDEFFGDDFLQFINPIVDDTGVAIGVTLIELSIDPVEQTIGQLILLASIISVVVVIGGVIASQILTRRLVQPIVALTTAASALAQHDWDQAIDTERRDEVGTLARAFQSMAEQLRHSVNQLESNVTSRTHDLMLATEVTSQLTVDIQVAHEISKQITTTSDVQEFLQFIAGVIVERFKLQSIAFLMLSPNSRQLTWVAGIDGSGVVYRPEELAAVQLDSMSNIALAARTREPIRANYISGSREVRFREIVLPLLGGRDLIGVMDIRTQERGFDENVIMVLEILALQAALAIQNTRLMQTATAAQRQTAEIDLLRGQQLNDMSRELRSPIHDMLNLSDLIAAGFLGEVSDSQVRVLNNMIGYGEDLLVMINGILGKANVEINRIDLFVEPVDMQALLRDTLLVTESLLTYNRPVKLVSNLPEKNAVVWGDDRRLRHIILILLVNAIERTSQGVITLRTHHENDLLYLTVVDGGKPLTPEEQQQLFNDVPLRSLPTSASRPELRIQLVRQVVEALGGKLAVTSVNDRGMSVTISLLLVADDEA